MIENPLFRRIAVLQVAVVAMIMSDLAYAETGDSEAMEEATEILREIVTICEEKGLLTCEPGIKGVPEFFQLVRTFEDSERVEALFEGLLQEKYGVTFSDFAVFQLSQRLRPNITFTANQFDNRISSAERVDGGYDLIIDERMAVAIRQDSSGWTVDLSEVLGQQTQRQTLQRYLLAGELKKTIIAYRMIEADITDISVSDLEAALTGDLGAILLAFFPEDRELLSEWHINEVNDVVAFYSVFTSSQQMADQIREAHGLRVD